MGVQLNQPATFALPRLQGPAPARFGSTPLETILPFQEGPRTDVFEKKASKPTVETTADQLTNLLSKDEDRKANAATFFQLVTGIKPFGTPADEHRSQEKQTELKALAETVRRFSPEQRVDFMKQLTGAESPYSRVAESILVNRQMPGMNDLLDCFRPENRPQPGAEGTGIAMQTAAVGLLMLPVVCPASLIFRPELLGQVAAALAIAVL